MNDLKTNLEQQINLLDKKKIIVWVSKPLKEKALENFKCDKKNIKLSKPNKIIVSKNRTKIFDALTTERIWEIVNLKKIILNKNDILENIKSIINNNKKIILWNNSITGNDWIKKEIKSWAKMMEISKNKTKIFDSLTNSHFTNKIDLAKIISNQGTWNVIFKNIFKKDNIKEKQKSFFSNKRKSLRISLSKKNIDKINIIILETTKIKEKISNYRNFDFISYIKKIDKKRVNKFIIILILFISIDIFLVKIISTSAINNVKSINKTNIESNITKAKYKFLCANILFFPFSIIPQNDLQNINHILKVWFVWSKLTSNILEIKDNTDFIKITFSDLLKQNKEKIIDFSNDFNYITKNINSVKLKKEDNNYKKVEQLKNITLKINNSLKLINSDFSNFLDLIWDNKTKKYLIAFQNNDEIRTNWWFMWSVWVLNIFKWKIQSFEKQDIYALEWEINKNYINKISPPEPINKLTTSFWLRDSNNYIDFNESAKAMNYFLKMWNYNFDWVIFINMSSIEKILEKIWYVDFEKIDTLITSSNFAEIISILVEAKTHKEWTLWTPKQILFDFAIALEEKIKTEQKNILILWEIILEEIKNREIVAIAFNQEENKILKSIWITWDIDFTKTLDFIYPVFISIWWNKSDRYIERKLEKQIKQESNCDIKTNISIELKHTYNNEDMTRIMDLMYKYWVQQNNDLLNIQWAWTNKTFTKIILPWNINIKNDNSLKIEKLKNITIVSYYTNINPWNKSIKNIEYTIKNPECLDYNLEIYKQAWIRKYDLNIDTKIFNNIDSDFYYKTWK